MKFQVINPATEEVIAELEALDKKAVSLAVKKARKAFDSWGNTDFDERETIIKKFGELLSKNKSEIAKLISREMGKAIIEAEGELEGSLGDINWLLSEARAALKDEELKVDVPDIKASIRFEPVGVVGLITPWNFPFGTALWKIIPALLTGNTIVFKPSELSTLCGMKIADLFNQAGLPEGVFNIVIGDAITGRHLVKSKVNMISFTGSTKAGRAILSKAGKGLKKTVMELGGSDPFIVFEDAQLEQAVNAAVFGRYLNCGQVCTAAKRIFIQEKIYDAFLQSFVDKVKKLRSGNPLDRKTEIGPIVSRKQLLALEVQVNDAISKGAKVLCGGKRIQGKGFFFEPTVLTGIKKNMLVLNEEVFGPVASIIPFKSVKQAIKLANNIKYGLGASVWTQNKQTAEEMINAIESGMIWVNDFGTPYPQCPQGGIKESGLGREMSIYGIKEFCNMKSVVVSEDKTIRKPWWFPYGD